MKISASQISTFDDCHRKWWLQSVERLPKEPKGYLIFGTVLHACLQRWCSANGQGRVPDPVPACLTGQKPGDAVEVYPEGWDSTITPNEAGLIRKLLKQAVERGIIERGDGRLLEHEFTVPLIPDVDLTGIIDIFLSHSTPKEIHDNKSFGEGSTRFLKQEDETSPNYIGKDQQVLTYVAAVTDRFMPVVVRHNQFPKFDDPRGVREVHTLVKVSQIQGHWESLQIRAWEMLRTKDIKRWQDVRGPDSIDMCSKYGGCAFRGICGKTETLEGYRNRVLALALDKSVRPNINLTPRKLQKMSIPTTDIFARLRAAKVAASPPPATTPAAPTVPASSPDAPAINGGVAPPENPPVVNAPPWAQATCTACKGTGFATTGRTCPICDLNAKRHKRPTSNQYVVVGSLDEGFKATVRDEYKDELTARGFILEWDSKGTAKVVPDVVVAPTVAVVQEPTPAATPEAPPVEAPPVETKTDGRGRKATGITMLIGCAWMKGPQRPNVTAQELLDRLGKELARDMGAQSYWELDPFKRRDRIRQRADVIAEQLGKTILMVPNLADPDAASLVAALLPHSEIVIEGLR